MLRDDLPDVTKAVREVLEKSKPVADKKQQERFDDVSKTYDNMRPIKEARERDEDEDEEDYVARTRNHFRDGPDGMNMADAIKARKLKKHQDYIKKLRAKTAKKEPVKEAFGDRTYHAPVVCMKTGKTLGIVKLSAKNDLTAGFQASRLGKAKAKAGVLIGRPVHIKRKPPVRPAAVKEEALVEMELGKDITAPIPKQKALLNKAIQTIQKNMHRNRDIQRGIVLHGHKKDVKEEAEPVVEYIKKYEMHNYLWKHRDEHVKQHHDSPEFKRYVDDVHAHAARNKIKDPAKALISYADNLLLRREETSKPINSPAKDMHRSGLYKAKVVPDKKKEQKKMRLKKIRTWEKSFDEAAQVAGERGKQDPAKAEAAKKKSAENKDFLTRMISKAQSSTKKDAPEIKEAVHPMGMHLSLTTKHPKTGKPAYKVHAVGKKIGDRIKVGEYLSDTEVDDAKEIGLKVKHVKEERIDEISDKLKSKYVQRAVDSHGHANFARRNTQDPNEKKAFARVEKNRAKGISRALTSKVAESAEKGVVHGSMSSVDKSYVDAKGKGQLPTIVTKILARRKK